MGKRDTKPRDNQYTVTLSKADAACVEQVRKHSRLGKSEFWQTLLHQAQAVRLPILMLVDKDRWPLPKPPPTPPIVRELPKVLYENPNDLRPYSERLKD